MLIKFTARQGYPMCKLVLNRIDLIIIYYINWFQSKRWFTHMPITLLQVLDCLINKVLDD